MYSQLLALYLALNGRLQSCLAIVMLLGTLVFIVYRLARWTSARSERDFFIAMFLCMVSGFCVAGHLNRFSTLLYLSSLPAQRIDLYQDPVRGVVVVSERMDLNDYSHRRDVYVNQLRLHPKSFMLLWPAARSFYFPERPARLNPWAPRPPDILL